MPKTEDLQTRFKNEIVPSLQKTLGMKNIMEVPKVEKVTLNVGLGTYLKKHAKDYATVAENLGKIAGQKAMLTKAKKSVSNFKIREDDIIGAAVTLRGKEMNDFLDKLVNVVFPRVRDFRGISKKAFDRNGNFNVGFSEHTVFPEINPDDIMKLHGIQISITTTAKDDNAGYELLKAIGFPFKKTN